MTITQGFQHSIKSIFIVGLIALLTACGGGGGGGTKATPTPTPKDMTPAPFTFAAVTGAVVSAEVTSAEVTITGIDAPAAISITGGQYSVAGGAFTATAATVTVGQVVKVKVTASATTNTAVSAVLTVGGVSGTFTVTTAPDTTPDAFLFPPLTDAAPGLPNTLAITVSGIDVAVPISVTGGEYAINDGAFTNVAGTVNNGQKVTLKNTAANAVTTTTNATLTIGGVSATFAVTTTTDKIAPIAKILFPPPVSMTEGSTILVRGSAKDDFGTVTKVTVNNLNAPITTSTDGSVTWQVEVPLNTGENDLQVQTEDSAGNKTALPVVAAHASIKKAALTEPFPSVTNGWDRAVNLVLDNFDGRNRLILSAEGVYAIDPLTAQSSFLAPTIGFSSERAAIINPVNKHYYIFDDDIIDIDLANPANQQVYANNVIESAQPSALAFNTDTSVFALATDSGSVIISNTTFTDAHVLSDETTPNGENPIESSYGIAYDSSHKRYLVTNLFHSEIIAVDATTGVRSIFSGNTVGTGPGFDGNVAGIEIDTQAQRVLVSAAGTGNIYAVDLGSGNRILISSSTSGTDLTNPLYGPVKCVISDTRSYAFVADITYDRIVAVDLVTGKRVIFVKN